MLRPLVFATRGNGKGMGRTRTELTSKFFDVKRIEQLRQRFGNHHSLDDLIEMREKRSRQLQNL
jgi:hypothetical protein